MIALRRCRLVLVLGFIALCAVAWPSRALGQRSPTLGSIGENARPSVNKTPTALTDIGIEDRSGALVPLDVRLTSNAGKGVTLQDYVDGERPLLLVLAYYNCPQLCSLVINGMLDGMKTASWTAGDQYRVLVVSFDPRDGLEVAQEKQKNYLAAYGREVATPKQGATSGFEFTVGAESEVRRLADALGFHYQWDPATNQYAHAAGVFVITPQGRLATTLTGVRFAGEEIQKELISADQNVSHAPLSAVLMRCYVYDAKAGKYVIDARFIMKIAGGVCVFGLAAFVLRLARRPRPPGPNPPPLGPAGASAAEPVAG